MIYSKQKMHTSFSTIVLLCDLRQIFVLAGAEASFPIKNAWAQIIPGDGRRSGGNLITGAYHLDPVVFYPLSSLAQQRWIPNWIASNSLNSLRDIIRMTDLYCHFEFEEIFH